MNPFTGTSSRGGFAPRRGQGQGGRYPYFNKVREQPKPDFTKRPLGDLFHTISASDLDVGANTTSHSTEISGCEYVASYNWTNETSPTIVVPGKPPKWTPLTEPQRLKEDSGQYFRDLNAAKNPSYPMAPAVNAVLEQDYRYRTDDIDIFACGSTLGNLLRFARGVDKPFRFNLQVINRTVFLVRKENDPKELIEGVRGYGHTFPEAYTTWEDDVKNSISHQRIICYKFGGLTHLLRFESDGYILDLLPEDTTPPPRSGPNEDNNNNTNAKNEDKEKNASPEKHLIHSLQALTIQAPTIIPSTSTIPPHTTLFDLKTRSAKNFKKIDMTDILPQLWLKRIPNFITAYHDGHGLFTDISVRNVEPDVQDWAVENSTGIEKFAVLLRELVRIAREKSHSGTDVLMEVYCPGKEKLEVRMQAAEGQEALPWWLRERWEGNGKEEGKGRADSPVENGLDDDDDDEEEEEQEDFVGVSRRYDSYYGSEYDSGSEPDYTACSADDCGYCGKCSY
ncbi:hypothetical protein COCMIDRAFT_8863 [Bipolaris oryzae ATCC 44560]|uniref:Geranylgeranyl pyrophosphate synthetase n=1 Tax=Bipolaris oryzae ATCC 44560 TaxID=930090 RepID=W6YV66_COCMI|nr:uncharacterized protein COCMIDRAFT_8863 [Bipolaris oryzae ATCC 44560]EUC41435.1 hypothetical protein COCMIDRAFT_8863 [Bipolaris oryzae ATCC 44560]